MSDSTKWNTGYVCLGYNPEQISWGGVDTCPRGTALYSEANPGGSHSDGPGEFVPITGPCCKLPFDDILTDDHLYNIAERCPDNYVITGQAYNCGSDCYMRCTRINTEKYQLGTERMSYYWKERGGNAVSGQGSAKAIFHDEIPAAIRFSAGREGHNWWGGDGCIGVPFGSLTTRKSKKTCDGFFHRQLQYKDGTPVPMFPYCDSLDDPYDPDAKCLRGTTASSSNAESPAANFEH